MILLTALLASSPLTRAGKPDAQADSPTPAASASPRKFDVPIPIGHDAHGVTIPYFDARGHLEMLFNIHRAFRTDLDHLAMERAYMQSYDEKEMPDTNVFMTSSVLDLNTRIVTSDVPVNVRRSDLEIVGQKMIFNTQTRTGRMWGHVRMIIYNRQDVSSQSPSPSPSPTSPPSPTPSAAVAASPSP